MDSFFYISTMRKYIALYLFFLSNAIFAQQYLDEIFLKWTNDTTINVKNDYRDNVINFTKFENVVILKHQFNFENFSENEYWNKSVRPLVQNYQAKDSSENVVSYQNVKLYKKNYIFSSSDNKEIFSFSSIIVLNNNILYHFYIKSYNLLPFSQRFLDEVLSNISFKANTLLNTVNKKNDDYKNKFNTIIFNKGSFDSLFINQKLLNIIDNNQDIKGSNEYYTNRVLPSINYLNEIVKNNQNSSIETFKIIHIYSDNSMNNKKVLPILGSFTLKINNTNKLFKFTGFYYEDKIYLSRLTPLNK